MAASFCKFKGVAAFLCRFKVCADWICLGNVNASHTRAFFRLQRQTRGLQRVRSERAAFLRRFGNQRGKTSDVGSRVINSSKIREVGGNELRRRRASKTRERRNGGVCETDPPQEDRYPFVLKSDQQDKIKDKISGCPHRTNGWVATIQDLDYIL